MKPYRDLTRIGRLRRTRQLAQRALEAYGLSTARLTFLRYFANITYRVDLSPQITKCEGTSPYSTHRYLLRVLLSNNWEYAQGEMTWLAALSNEAGLAVPAPVPNRKGVYLMRVKTPGIPDGRIVSLMRWVERRKPPDTLSASQYRAWGSMVGQLHAFARTWQPPEGFQRFTWDWDGLLGGHGFANTVDTLVATMPPKLRDPFQAVSQKAKTVMQVLGKGPDAYGMVHGDMYAENVLIKDGHILPIDFEDCGFGYWLWDIAAALSTAPWTEAWYGQRDAFLTGYNQVHPLPESQLQHLDLFLAVTYATGVLWASQFMLDEPGRKTEHEGWRDESGVILLRYFASR